MIQLAFYGLVIANLELIMVAAIGLRRPDYCKIQIFQFGFKIVVSTCFKIIRKCFNFFQNEAFSHLSKFIQAFSSLLIKNIISQINCEIIQLLEFPGPMGPHFQLLQRACSLRSPLKGASPPSFSCGCFSLYIFFGLVGWFGWQYDINKLN